MDDEVGHVQLTHVVGRPTATEATDERGITLLVTTLIMVGLLVMGAIVIDIGAVYSERRRDQSAADSSSLAAAQDLGDDGKVVATAIAYANSSLRAPLPAPRYNTCASDTQALAVRASGANCISFNTARTRVRMRLPDQFSTTAFGGVVGVDQIRHTAFAVGAITRRGFGGVLPFGMPVGAGAGDGYTCLKSNSGGQSQPPCDGPDSGNFGTIDLTLFGNDELGTRESCGSGDSRSKEGRIANNIAVGSDHALAIYAGTTVVDSQVCPSLPPAPNAAVTETGLNAGTAGSGLFSGSTFSDNGPARLKRTDENLFAGGGKTRMVFGQRVDDNPLWLFIPAGLSGDVPASCRRNQFVDSNDAPTTANLPADVKSHLAPLSVQERMVSLLARCMTHYRGLTWKGSSARSSSLTPAEPRSGCALTTDAAPVACTDPVFGLNSSESESPDLFDIQYTPRFGYVPQLTEPFPSGSKAVKFAAFRAIFIQRLTVATSGGGTAFDPGFGPGTLGGSTETSVREVTIWAFPNGMLPGELDGNDAPNAIGVNRFVQLVR